MQRNDRQRVFHFSRAEGVAPEELEIACRVEEHTQVATADEVDIVGMVSVQRANNVRLLVYFNAHGHRKSAHVGSHFDRFGYRIAEVRELDEVVHLAVCCESRFPQHICHVCSAENVELAEHGKTVERAFHRAEIVYVCLAVDFGTRCFFSINEQEIFGFHAHIEVHILHIREVERALDVQRAVVVGIHLEVLEQQFAVLYAHRVVGEPHSYTVRSAV